MDFCQLLHKAKKNDQPGSNGGRYYSTKFEPPKKMKKEGGNLSENIKKFLAKKEAEETQKLKQEQRKKETLLALRSQDRKAVRRVNIMLKKTKSANQSVIEDAIDKTHTAITRDGPEQPDGDDYGYVSQEASVYYDKLMEKYSQMPEEPKFDLFKKKISTNLSNTKDRVKAALDKEKEASMLPRKRKRRSKDDGGHVSDDKEDDSKVKDERVKPKPKPAPPPLSFMDLIKLAEKKQHEPILVEEKPKEDEKLFTKKQKRELEKEKEYREGREKRERNRHNEPDDKSLRIPKLPCNDNNNVEAKPKPTVQGNKSAKLVQQASTSNSGEIKKYAHMDQKLNKQNTNTSVPYRDNKAIILLKNGNQKLPNRRNVSQEKSKNTQQKEFPPKDLISKNNNIKTKEFSPRDLKLKQFPQRDVQGLKRRKPPQKGRIIDDDDEEEYDPEMDDFIDDDPQEGDYSKYIKEIFGYDKSRFRDVDDDVDNMESSFAQQMKEEVISAKIGIMEDLEDIKKEEAEKRRKAMMSKKLKR